MWCEKCGKDATLVCSGCKHTRYCSAECQSEDWKNHKKPCKIQQMLNVVNEAEAAKPQPRPPKGRCTGCNVRFNGDYPCADECPECGYQACESCDVHHSKGTCYCQNHNFGRNYCEMEPRWYHRSGRTGKSYSGDRHPDEGYIMRFTRLTLGLALLWPFFRMHSQAGFCG
ncbi:MYND-type zinc finger protein samB [Abortiporus biennis]